MPARVVAALPLPEAALAALRARLNDDAEIVDIRRAGDDADLVLCPPCSPQTIARLRRAFPSAQVLVLELDDPAWGLRSDGPVKRTLDAGAAAYLVAPSLDAVARIVSMALPAGRRAPGQLLQPSVDGKPSVDEEIALLLDAHERPPERET